MNIVMVIRAVNEGQEAGQSAYLDEAQRELLEAERSLVVTPLHHAGVSPAELAATFDQVVARVVKAVVTLVMVARREEPAAAADLERAMGKFLADPLAGRMPTATRPVWQAVWLAPYAERLAGRTADTEDGEAAG